MEFGTTVCLYDFENLSFLFAVCTELSRQADCLNDCQKEFYNSFYIISDKRMFLFSFHTGTQSHTPTSKMVSKIENRGGKKSHFKDIVFIIFFTPFYWLNLFCCKWIAKFFTNTNILFRTWPPKDWKWLTHKKKTTMKDRQLVQGRWT